MARCDNREGLRDAQASRPDLLPALKDEPASSRTQIFRSHRQRLSQALEKRILVSAEQGPKGPLVAHVSLDGQQNPSPCAVLLFRFATPFDCTDRAARGRPTVSVDHALARLQKIHETLVLYTNGAAERILSEMDSTQRHIAEAVGVIELVQQMGNTLLGEN